MINLYCSTYAYCHTYMHTVHTYIHTYRHALTSPSHIELVICTVCMYCRYCQASQKILHRTVMYVCMFFFLYQVARKKPYNHKVDVHSFGIIVWEMVTGKVPFKGVNRDEFMSQVVEKNFRPNLSKTVPHQALANLLQDCWNPNPLLRPNFEQILANLTSMIAESEASTSQHSSSSSTGAGGKKTSTGRSRWF